MADYIAKVNPRYFAAAQLFAAQNDIRYYLNGVCIEPHPEGGAILVATDGHTLAAIHDPEGFARETIIVGGITKGLISACKTKGNPLTFTRPEQLLIGKTCAVVTGHKSQEPEPDPFDPLTLHASKIELIDGKFPDWRRVMPVDRKGDSARLPAVNVRYLGRLAEAFSILRPGKGGGRAMRCMPTPQKARAALSPSGSPMLSWSTGSSRSSCRSGIWAGCRRCRSGCGRRQSRACASVARSC